MKDSPAPRSIPLRLLLSTGLAGCFLATSAMATSKVTNNVQVSANQGVDQRFLAEIGRVAERRIEELNGDSSVGKALHLRLVSLETKDGRFGLEATAVVEGQLDARARTGSPRVVRGRATAAAVGRDRELIIRSALRRASENAFNHLSQSRQGS